MSLVAARRVIEAQCGGTLLPDVVLPFDDPDFADCTVGDVLVEPERFAGRQHPVEGVGYAHSLVTSTSSKSVANQRNEGTDHVFLVGPPRSPCPDAPLRHCNPSDRE